MENIQNFHLNQRQVDYLEINYINLKKKTMI